MWIPILVALVLILVIDVLLQHFFLTLVKRLPRLSGSLSSKFLKWLFMPNPKNIMAQGIAVVIALVLSLLVVVFAPALPQQNQARLRKLQVMPLTQSLPPSKIPSDIAAFASHEGAGNWIGLSDGNIAFNTLDPDFLLKDQAARAFLSGKTSDAEVLWQQQIQQESQVGKKLDAETLIYQEDQHVLDSHTASFPILVGVAFNKQIKSDGIAVLQGIYVAQHTYNQDPDHATKMRVILANFGVSLEDAREVADAIVRNVQDNNPIMALIDLPVSANTPEILHKLSGCSGCHFPIVLSNGSNSSREEGPTIFHLNSSPQLQAQQAANYVEQNCPYQTEGSGFDCPGSQIVVFMNKEDPYSSILGESFEHSLEEDNHQSNAHKMYHTVYYEPNGVVASLVTYLSTVRARPALIYFAGEAEDANTLLRNLPPDWQQSNLRILGGDALFQPGQYTAKNYAHMSFTAFAFPDMVDTPAGPAFLGTSSFYGTYGNTFDPAHTKSGLYGFGRADASTILAYDALGVVIQGRVAEVSTPDALLSNLRAIKNDNSYPGVSGWIAFGSDGNPISRTILFLRVNANADTEQETLS